MENYKELLIELYKRHAPEKLDQIDFYLDRYKGKEKQFYITQKAKYDNTRSVKDSKKILEQAMKRIARQKMDSEEKKTTTEKPAVISDITKSDADSTAPKKSVTDEKKADKVKAVKAKNTSIKNTDTAQENHKLKESEEISTTPTPQESEKQIKKVANLNIIDETKKHDLEKEKQLRKEQLKKEALKIKEDAEQKSKANDSQGIINQPTAEELIRDAQKDKENKELEKLVSAKKRHQASKDQEKKQKEANLIIWYFGSAAIIILLLAIFIYFNYFYVATPHRENVINVQKVKIETKAVNTTNAQEETAPATQNNEKVKDTKVEKPTTKTSKKVPVVKEKPQKIFEKEAVHPTAERLYTDDIAPHSIFVSCFAVKKEAYAQKKVAALKAANLEAHYYWIPDIDHKGNAYFKIVVGPFASIKKANPSLTKVQEYFNFDAYIINIK